MEFHKGFWTASLGIVGLMGGLGYVDHVRSSQFMDNEAALLADADRHCLSASGVVTPGAFAPGVFSASTFSGERTCAEKKRYAVKSSPAAPAPITTTSHVSTRLTPCRTRVSSHQLI